MIVTVSRSWPAPPASVSLFALRYIPAVDNSGAHVDAFRRQTFLLTQPVDGISDVMKAIRPQDHYRPAHQIIHDAILDLYGRGEPADAVTVSDLLGKRGELSRVGGGTYLHTLIASVPTAANAGYYARIVRERAILRRLVEVGTRIVQLGYAGDGDADELVDRPQAEVYGVTEP